MEAKTTFIGAESAVEFHTETAVDVHLAVVVLPGYPEDNLPFRLAYALDDFALKIFGMLAYDGSEGFEDFGDCLMEFNLARITLQNVLINSFEFFVHLR